MQRGKEKASAVRISLLDVMYGVVLAYGFGFFDQANTIEHYILLLFAYAVIIFDWIYVHTQYWGWEYKHNDLLVLDIAILFAISRLFATSIHKCNNPIYWLWMAFLFLIYFIWDIRAKQRKLPTEYDLRYSIGGDLFATIAFLVFFILRWENILEPTVFSDVKLIKAIPLDAMPIILYIIAISTWFKKLPQAK